MPPFSTHSGKSPRLTQHLELIIYAHKPLIRYNTSQTHGSYYSPVYLLLILPTHNTSFFCWEGKKDSKERMMIEESTRRVGWGWQTLTRHKVSLLVDFFFKKKESESEAISSPVLKSGLFVCMFFLVFRPLASSPVLSHANQVLRCLLSSISHALPSMQVTIPVSHPSTHQRHARKKNQADVKTMTGTDRPGQDQGLALSHLYLSTEEGCFCTREPRRCCPSLPSRILVGWRPLAQRGTSRLQGRLCIQILSVCVSELLFECRVCKW